MRSFFQFITEDYPEYPKHPGMKPLECKDAGKTVLTKEDQGISGAKGSAAAHLVKHGFKAKSDRIFSHKTHGKITLTGQNGEGYTHHHPSGGEAHGLSRNISRHLKDLDTPRNPF